MVAEIAGNVSKVEGRSTFTTVPVQTRLHGSETGIRKIISICVCGSIHSGDRKRTPAAPIFSVYPESH